MTASASDRTITTALTRLGHAPSPDLAPRSNTPLCRGVFLGGFECSDHRLECGRRLDMLASTRHEELASADYARLRALGMTACREGVSWVRSERAQANYDFSSAARRLEAAEQHEVQVFWDLLHFGWPDHVDVWSPAFPAQFGRFADGFARWYAGATDAPAVIAPINEMSFLSWAGGDVRVMNPFEAARGVELKVQFVLATIEAIEAIRRHLPAARFLAPEPLMHMHPNPEHPRTWRRVESDNLLQYQAWDMLSGRVWPRLGGGPQYLDILGVNYYPDNQFMLDGATVRRDDARYRPFSELLFAVHERYQRPLIVSETGCEGDARAEWLRYVVDECCTALRAGCELHGVTLYPIVNHPGWVDERHCHNGLWDYASSDDERPVHEPLAAEIAAQTSRLTTERAAMLSRTSAPPRQLPPAAA